MTNHDTLNLSQALNPNQKNQRVLIEIHYLPGLVYFAALQPYGEIIIERHEHYVKQSYRNRCYINTEHGRHVLIIPITSKHGKICITDVRIDHSQKWVNNHWRTILSAYRKAPFFEHYAHDLERILFTRFEFLYDLNVHLLSMCLKWLQWSVAIGESLSYTKTLDEGVADMRSLINPKKTDFEKNIFKPVPYYQVFGNAFVSNLSLIDLIFCNGPDAGRIIKASIVRQVNKY